MDASSVRWVNRLVALVSALLAMSASELFLRWVDPTPPNPQVLARDDRGWPIFGRKATSEEHGCGRRVSINADGFRGREFAGAVEGSVGADGRQSLRVIVAGDSFAWGYLVEDDETVAAHLERELVARGFLDPRVVTVARPGAHMAAIESMLDVYVPMLRPQAVVLLANGNDSGTLPGDVDVYSGCGIETTLFERLAAQLLDASRLYARVHPFVTGDDLCVKSTWCGASAAEDQRHLPHVRCYLASLSRTRAKLAERGVCALGGVYPATDVSTKSEDKSAFWGAEQFASRAVVEAGWEVVEIERVVRGIAVGERAVSVECADAPAADPHPNGRANRAVAGEISEALLASPCVGAFALRAGRARWMREGDSVRIGN